jgi:hypothetical protein
MNLIGRQMFAIDGVKLPANASKERSGTHAELLHRADRLQKAADKIIGLHQSQDSSTQEVDVDAQRQARIDALRKEAQTTRDFVASSTKRLNRKGQELKVNVTDPDSAKMATSKGVIQGYAAQAAVDSAHQVIVAADVIGSGSEQSMLMPMVEQSNPVRAPRTLITADAGYHNNDNIAALKEGNIPAMIADNQMRSRDERFKDQGKHKAKADPLYDKRAITKEAPIRLYRPSDFVLDPSTNSCICPAGHHLYSNGSHCAINGRVHHKFSGSKSSCVSCQHRSQCLRHPQRTAVRQVAIFVKNQPSPHAATELMKRAIDSPRGRQLYSQRVGTVEPVFGNIRHNKRLSRFTLRGKTKVATQWNLYCLVHNIEKLAHHGYQ